MARSAAQGRWAGLPLALAHSSASMIYRLERVLQSGRPPRQQSGAYKRKVQQIFGEVARCCFLGCSCAEAAELPRASFRVMEEGLERYSGARHH